MSARIRIGVAGLNWGAGHARAIAEIPAFELVALADTDVERLDSLGKELGATGLHGSADELLLSGAVDAVVIATPSYLHERQVGTALDKGLHVLCESPVGIRGSEVSHVVTSAGLVGKTFMWSNPLRFDPRVEKASSLISEGTIGEVFRASSRSLLSRWTHPPDSWRLDRERGGGALLEVGLPALDAVWFAMGAPDPMEALAGSYDRFSSGYAEGMDKVAEDSLEGLVRLKNGALLQHAAQIHLGSEATQELEMRIWGSLGSVDLVRGTVNTEEGSNTYAEPIGIEQQFTRQLESFAQAISQGENDPANAGKEALALMKMVDALANSAKEKTAQRIKVERSLDDLFESL